MFRRWFTWSAPGSGATSPTRPSSDEQGQGQGQQEQRASQQERQQLERLHTMFRSASLPSSSTQSLRGPLSSSAASHRGALPASMYATVRGPPRPTSGDGPRAGLHRSKTTAV